MTEWIISSTVLMLIVIGLRTALKGRISLGLQYALWLLVLVRLLVPINFTQSALSVLGAAEQAMEAPVMQTVTEIATVRPPVRSYEEAYAQVVAQYEADGVDVDTLTGSDRDILELEAYEQMKADVSVGELVTDGLTVIWLAGMAVTALCLLGTNLRFALALRRSRRTIPVNGCPLRVYVTEAVDTPCLFGPVKPAIYLTADAPWDEKAMEHILTHERTHYRHGDHIWSVLRCVCLVLHWYNPLVWLCADLSRRDGELACDEASIRALGEARRAEYGRTLIEMTCQKPHGMVGLTATTMIYSKKSLRERIQLIARHPKTAAYTLVLVILVAGLAVGCTFTGTPEETTEPTQTATEPATDGPTEPPADPTQPSEERLAEYQALFQWEGDMLFNRAAGHEYAKALDVDLYYLFYCGVDYPGSWSSIDDSERTLLVQQGFIEEMDIQIMPAKLLEEKLLQYFGVGLGGVRIPDGWVYSSATDTYYSNHNDAYINTVTVTGYTDQPDGTVVLHLLLDYAVDGEEFEEFYANAPMYMTLRPTEDGYRIVSNVFGYSASPTWAAPEAVRVYPFTDEEIAEAVAVVEAEWADSNDDYRIEYIAFDPVTTDHWARANYATDRLEGMALEDYYEIAICMAVRRSTTAGGGDTFVTEFLLMRDGASGDWAYMHSGSLSSYYPTLLLDADDTAFSGVEGEIVAAYRANDGVHDYWLYVRDPQTGEIRYTAG